MAIDSKPIPTQVTQYTDAMALAASVAGGLVTAAQSFAAVEADRATFRVVKTVDETVNNSDTLQADDELLIPVLANKTYLVEVRLIGISFGTTAHKIGWTVPAGASFLWMPWGQSDAGGVTPSKGAADTQAYDGIASGKVFSASGLLIVGANAGNLALIWGQNSAAVGDTKFLIGSCLTAIETG